MPVLGSEIVTGESVLCSISIILVKIKYTCGYELRNTNCEISMIHVEIKGSYIAFKAGKMTGKIHANNL